MVLRVKDLTLVRQDPLQLRHPTQSETSNTQTTPAMLLSGHRTAKLRENAKRASLGQTGVFKTRDEDREASKRQRAIPLE